MKVVFPTCCGVDVHKTFLVATIITTPADSLQPNYQKKRFSTFNSDFEYSALDCAPRPLRLSIRSGGIEHPCRRR